MWNQRWILKTNFTDFLSVRAGSIIPDELAKEFRVRPDLDPLHYNKSQCRYHTKSEKITCIIIAEPDWPVPVLQKTSFLGNVRGVGYFRWHPSRRGEGNNTTTPAGCHQHWHWGKSNFHINLLNNIVKFFFFLCVFSGILLWLLIGSAHVYGGLYGIH